MAGADGRLPLVEFIRRSILRDILSGTLKPGEHIGEKKHGDKFGGSRTPVREALRQLVAEGWVEQRLHCGMFVPQDCPAGADLVECFAEILAMALRKIVAQGDVAGLDGVTDLDGLIALVPNRMLRDIVGGLRRTLELVHPLRLPVAELVQTLRAGDADDAEALLRRALS